MLQIQFPPVDRVLILVGGYNYIEDRLWVTGLTGDDAVYRVNARRSRFVFQNPAVEFTARSSCAQRRSGFIGVSTLSGVRHVEKRLINLLNANEVLHVFVKITHRKVAVVAVVPLNRNVNVIGLEGFEIGITAVTVTTVDSQ